jgi:hypothetical protein
MENKPKLDRRGIVYQVMLTFSGRWGRRVLDSLLDTSEVTYLPGMLGDLRYEVRQGRADGSSPPAEVTGLFHYTGFGGFKVRQGCFTDGGSIVGDKPECGNGPGIEFSYIVTEAAIRGGRTELAIPAIDLIEFSFSQENPVNPRILDAGKMPQKEDNGVAVGSGAKGELIRRQTLKGPGDIVAAFLQGHHDKIGDFHGGTLLAACSYQKSIIHEDGGASPGSRVTSCVDAVFRLE